MSHLPSASSLLRRLESREAAAGVVGLGYVGLPLAVEFARSGLRTVGIDLDARKVQAVHERRSYIPDVSDADVAALVDSGRLSATTDFGVLGRLDERLPPPPRAQGRHHRAVERQRQRDEQDAGPDLGNHRSPASSVFKIRLGGGAVFVFFGRRRDALKILFFDGTGMCLLYKRLDRGTFRVPEATSDDATAVAIDDAALDALLDGVVLDASPRKTRRRVH